MDEVKRRFGMHEDSILVSECLSKTIGYAKETELRRCTTDMKDMLLSREWRSFLYSGSYAEGFRFETSDKDIMIWCNGVKAVCDTSQMQTRGRTDVLLMDTSRCRPGFSRLKVLRVNFNAVNHCLTFADGEAYINASKFKEGSMPADTDMYLHGPCCTMKTAYGEEIDRAVCIKCDYWPTQAAEFITRSTRQRWPSISLLDEIVKNGCHLVPVGSRCSENVDLEWRVSFSMAEKRLIFNFNHTQFLCYGLLKLVLSQIINKEPSVSELLCSYFLKTSLFWEIQENDPTVWRPGNLLTCFWKCFDRLVSWIRSDFCPSFFIPENNMFYGKFNEKQQRDLLEYLQALRHQETGLLYRIPDLMDMKRKNVMVPVSPMYARYDEYGTVSLDINMAALGRTSDELQTLLIKCFVCKQQNTTAGAPAIVLDITLDIIVKTLLLRELHGFAHSTRIQNTDRYEIYRSRVCPYMRYLSSSFPCSKLYLATAFYMLGQYNRVLEIVRSVQRKLHPIDGSYPITLDDPDLRKHLCLPVLLSEEDHLDELKPEIEAVKKYQIPLPILPLLYLKWLTFMCNHHMKYRNKCKHALEGLHELFNDFKNDYWGYKDLTFCMTGMCYEHYGDHRNALRLYRKSIRMNGLFCEAATCRLKSIKQRLKDIRNS